MPLGVPRGYVPAQKPEIANVMQVYDVYFVLGMTTHLVKIGYAKNAWSRMAQLQVGSAEELRLMASFETYLPIEAETDLHAHFADLRVRGEWFRLSEELVDYAIKYDPDADEDADPSVAAS